MLINTRDISNLARISLTDAEHLLYGQDISSILEFIDTIKSLSLGEDFGFQSTGMAPIDVTRLDVSVSRSEEYASSDIAAQAPSVNGNFIKVKKILN